MLEQSKSRPAHAFPRTRPLEVVATGNHGRGDFQRAQRRTFPVTGGPQIWYSLSDIRTLRKSRSQHARTIDGRRHWLATEGTWTTAENSPRHLARRAHQSCHKECCISRRENPQRRPDDLRPTIGEFWQVTRNVSRKTHHTWDFNFYDFVSSMSLLLRLLTAISISRQLNGSVPKRNKSCSKSHRRDDSRASGRGAPTNVQYGRRSKLRCRL